MDKTLNMTRGNPLKLLVRFSLPLMLGNVFQQLYTVVDTAIVGKGVGILALAALGSVDWLNWLFLGVAQGFTSGFAVRVAQKFGLTLVSLLCGEDKAKSIEKSIQTEPYTNE